MGLFLILGLASAAARQERERREESVCMGQWRAGHRRRELALRTRARRGVLIAGVRAATCAQVRAEDARVRACRRETRGCVTLTRMCCVLWREMRLGMALEMVSRTMVVRRECCVSLRNDFDNVHRTF